MPGCAVQSCKNYFGKNGQSLGNLSYFTFPKNQTLCKKWIVQCRRNDAFDPKKVRVCSDHFSEDDYLRDFQSEMLGMPPKKKLKTEAFPHVNLPERSHEVSPVCTVQRSDRHAKRNKKRMLSEMLDETSPIITSNIESACNTEIRTDETQSDLHSELLSLQKQVAAQDVQLKDLRNELLKTKSKVVCLKAEKERLISNMKKMKQTMKKQIDFSNQKTQEILAQCFTPGQIKRLLKKKRTTWTEDDIIHSLALRSISPKAYNFLRKQGYPFPAVSILKRWVKHFSCRQGILHDVIYVMKEKGQHLNFQDKLTVLNFDEMNVSKKVCYDHKDDEIIGPHKNVQVVLARGLIDHWKQPVYYGFDQNINPTILFSIISTLEAAGYCVVAIVSDMGGTNQKLWKDLGIALSKTFFDHPSRDGQKIWIFADVPHMIKLLRNHFLDQGLLINGIHPFGKTMIREIIGKQELKLQPNLSEEHISVSGPARMKVRLAVQLFSHHTAVQLKRTFPHFTEAFNFVECVNAWFDVMNSRFIMDFKNPVHSAFGKRIEEQCAVLDKMYSLMSNLRIIGHNSLLPFQRGIMISITSLKGLYDDLTRQNIEFILTSRLNQDALENMFSQVRAMGRTHDHPSPVEFRYRLRLLLLGLRMPLPGERNCMSKCKDYILADVFFQQCDILDAPQIDNSPQIDISAVDHVHFESENEKEAMRYFAGYLASRSNTAENCSSEEADPNAWIEMLSRGGLTIPNQEFVGIVYKCEAIFRSLHPNESYCRGAGIIKKLHRLLQEAFPSVNPAILLRFAKTRTHIRIKYLNKAMSINTNHLKKKKAQWNK